MPLKVIAGQKGVCLFPPFSGIQAQLVVCWGMEGGKPVAGVSLQQWGRGAALSAALGVGAWLPTCELGEATWLSQQSDHAASLKLPFS